MAEEKYKSVSVFALPDAYQQQAAEARRRRRMAEMLAQQAYQPGDIQNAPIPAAAPLVQGLQAYLAARAGRKADEAEESARETASREARQLFRALTEEGDTTTNAVQPAMTPMAKTVTAPQFEDGRITAPASIEMVAPPPMTAPETQLSRYNLTPGQRRAAALEGMLTSENPMLQKVAGAIYPTLAPKTPETKTMEFGGRLLNVTGGQATPVTMDGVAVTEPTKQKARTAAQDFGGFIRTYYSDGSYTDERKTLAPSKPTAGGGRGQPPSGYKWTPEGNLEKISGGPADKPDGLSETAKYRLEDSMRTQFERLINPLETELSQIGKITTIVTNAGGNLKNIDAISQQSLVILLNKFLDPTSVVREGEFNRVVEAQGLIGQARNALDRIALGKPLDASTIQQITNLAGLYERAATSKIKQYAIGYGDTARKRGLDVGSIITNPNYIVEEIPDDDVEVK